MAKIQFKTKQWPHQIKALRKLIKKKGGALFVPMRWGKTKTAIDFATIGYYKWGIRRVLVICPHGALGVWRRELRKHCSVPYRLRDGTPDIHLPRHQKWMLVNYEMTYWRERDTEYGGFYMTDNQDVIDFEPEMVIVDESHKIGNPNTLQSKKAYKYGQEAKIRTILTGTPVHRKPLYLFGQFKFLDDTVFGTSWAVWKKKIGVWYGPVLKKYKNLKWVRKRMRPLAYIAKEVPLRPTVKIIRSFPLEESARVYDEMADESYTMLRGQKEIFADLALTRVLRLAQIASGHARDEDKIAYRVGREKQRAFAEWLEEAWDSEVHKLVVGCRFSPELKDVAIACKKQGYEVILMHGGLDSYVKEQRNADFDETDLPTVFVAQMQSASEAIDLSAADTLVYYTPPEGLLLHDQFGARIRKYRDKRALTYVYFCAEDSINMTAMAALEANRELVSYVMAHPDSIHRA